MNNKISKILNFEGLVLVCFAIYIQMFLSNELIIGKT